MDVADESMEVRRATQSTRRPPTEPHRIFADFQNGADLGDEIVPGPVELLIEATNDDGEMAEWFDDAWWMDVLERWADSALTVHIMPTPAALLHPVTLHHLEMIVRVAPRWRLVGHAYVSDVTTSDDIVALAKSPYHEVRFIDQARPSAKGVGRLFGVLPIAELFSRISRQQRRIKATRPVLIRLPGQAAAPETPQRKRAQTDTEAVAS